MDPATLLKIDSEAIAGVYGWNWAQVSSWTEFLHRLESIAAEDFEWRAQRPPAPSPLSLNALRVYIEAIEEDFRVFTYHAKTVEETSDGFVVRGGLEAVSRLAQEPLDRQFTHLWVLNGGGVKAVELLKGT